MSKFHTESLVVYLIAGEASGDALGAGIMRELFEMTGGNVIFHGIGGEKMMAAGLQESLFPYHDLSLMGFAEIVPHIITLTARINGVVEDIRVKQPGILLTIDSPGFCYRVAKKLKKNGACPNTKCVHYVAPSVWAYKPQRAKKFAEVFDHMLVLLPFEPPFFISEGLPCTFVGHPAACPQTGPGDGTAFREYHNIPPQAPLIGLLPGSRSGEIRRHIPAFAAGIMLMARHMPVLPGVVVPAPTFLFEEVTAAFKDYPLPVFVVNDEQEKRDGLAACNLALVKSGTVTLEVAMAGIPMVVAYRTSSISAAIIRRLIRIRHVNLLNILMQREIIPELLQELCEPIFIAEAVNVLYRSPERQSEQVRLAQEALAQLRPESSTHPHVMAATALLRIAG